MEKLMLSEIIGAVRGSFGYPADVEIEDISTDTRTIKPNSLFIALKGANFDGHDFAEKAMELGAAAVMTERPVQGARCLIVDSTAQGLLDVASYYRSKFDIPLVGITGSVGKTTTKDMIHSVLSRGFKTLKTEANHNNEVGMPKTLLELDSSYKAAVIEMGMDFKGSIAVLADIAEPDIGVITNVGISHLENFPEEGREGILSTKLEITKNFNEDSVLIINDDNDMLATVDMKERNIPGKLVRVGTGERCDFLVSNVTDKGIEGISFDISYNGETVSVELPVPGAHNAINAGLAMAAGCLKGMTLEETAAGFSKAELTANRLNVIKKDGITVIDDTYNAAPDSMKGAIDTLMSTPVPEGGRRIAILGDMGELGFESNRGHGEVGAYAHRKGVDVTLTVGPNSYAASKGWGNDAAQEGHGLRLIPTGPGMPLIETDEQTGKACEYFENKEMIIAGILEHIHEGDCILVKASRLMALEKRVEHIVNDK